MADKQIDKSEVELATLEAINDFYMPFCECITRHLLSSGIQYGTSNPS